MNRRRFALTPFRAEDDGPRIRITGTVGRVAKTLSLRCALRGDLSGVAIPPPEETPSRKDRLWEETCLELFLGAKGSERYWEFNLSPMGHWNVYRFTSYREEMRVEPAFGSLPLRVRTEPEAIHFSLDLDIGEIIPAGKAVEAAVCAVIKTVEGKTSHWAMIHPGTLPDFHRRDGFGLRIS